MPNRYLRGTGARNWNDTANWSDVSGGTGGASVPTSADNVIWDNNSGIGTITVNAIANMLDFTCSNIGALTLSNAAYAFNVFGSLTLHNSLTVNFTSTGYLYMKATDSRTITTNGKVANWNRLYFDGVGGTWSNQDDMNFTGTNTYHSNGTLNTNGWVIRLLEMYRSPGSFTYNLSSSTIYCVWINQYASTINAGTSTIISNGAFYSVGTATYYNVTINSPRSGNGLAGTNTYNNFTINGDASILSYIPVTGTHTINGALIIAGSNASNYRLLIASNSIGKSRTITCNGTVTAINVDFRDITLAGTCNKDLSSITGGSGDCGGNSGIVFTTAQPQYFKKYASTANYGDTANWFSDLDLTVAGRVPLPQDLGSKFIATSFDRTCTVSCNVPRIPCLDMSEIVNTVGFNLANALEVYGGFRYNSTYVTVSGNFLITCDIHGKIVQTPLYLGVATTFVNNFNVILSNTIAELIIDSGRKVRFTAGTTQTIGKITYGSGITQDCVTAGTYNLALTEIATAENINIKGCVVTQDSKLFAEANSVDSGSNNRVVFGDYFTVQEIIL